MPHPLRRLLDGFEEFRDSALGDDAALYGRLVNEGQSPEVLIVGCSDSRVDPAILTHCRPGDLFVVRNVAALVPPCEIDDRHHGTSAAIEFGVRGLGVGHVVVLGHAMCGGIRALAAHPRDCGCGGSATFLDAWVEIAGTARREVFRQLSEAPPDVRQRVLEQAAVVKSLGNLMTYPWVRERVVAGRLALHGWYFDLGAAELHAYDGVERRFLPVRGEARPLGETETACEHGCACRTAFDVATFVSRMAETLPRVPVEA
jgi:carbonic anhydrase